MAKQLAALLGGGLDLLMFLTIRRIYIQPYSLHLDRL
jgi:hypothetical protein